MGKNLTYIPVEVVQTERKLAGKLQIEGGYFISLCHKAHARYQVSADLKERLRILQDTSYSRGWDESKKKSSTRLTDVNTSLLVQVFITSYLMALRWIF